MVGVIVTGHGNFATGLLSSLKLIAGEQEHIVGVDFTADDSTETLEVKLKDDVDKLGEEIIVLSDLAGGSPFKVSVVLSQQLEGKKIKVVSGINLGMLLEVSLCRGSMSLDELVGFSIDSGKDAIKSFEIRVEEEIETYEFDGI